MHQNRFVRICIFRRFPKALHSIELRRAGPGPASPKSLRHIELRPLVGGWGWTPYWDALISSRVIHIGQLNKPVPTMHIAQPDIISQVLSILLILPTLSYLPSYCCSFYAVEPT